PRERHCSWSASRGVRPGCRLVRCCSPQFSWSNQSPPVGLQSTSSSSELCGSSVLSNPQGHLNIAVTFGRELQSRLGGRNRDVGPHSAAGHLASGRGIKLGGGQLQIAAHTPQRKVRLHGSLAVGVATDDDTPLVVLDGGGEDLACRGTVLVDQHHQRHLPGPIVVRLLEGVVLGRAPLSSNDVAIGDELIGDQNCLVQQTPRVAPQVHHQRLHPLVVQVPQCL